MAVKPDFQTQCIDADNEAARQRSHYSEIARRERVVSVLKSEQAYGQQKYAQELAGRKAYAREIIVQDAIARGLDVERCLQKGYSPTYR